MPRTIKEILRAFDEGYDEGYDAAMREMREPRRMGRTRTRRSRMARSTARTSKRGKTSMPKRKLSAWQKYIKNKKNHIKLRSGKLNLKKMAVQFRKTKKK